MELQSQIGPNSDQAHVLRNVEMICWKELPMSNRAAIECTNALLQLLIGNMRPFGRKIVVGLGDFRQVAPVGRNEGPTGSLDASIRSSWLWKQFHILRLHQPVRNTHDPVYSQWVHTIGEGNLTNSAIPLSLIRRIRTCEQIVEFLFPDFILLTLYDLCQRLFLSSLNSYVDEFNLQILDKIPLLTGK